MIDLLRVLCQIYRNDLVAKVIATIFFFGKNFPPYFTSTSCPYSFNILTLLEVPYPAFKKFLPLYTLTLIINHWKLGYSQMLLKHPK